MSSPYYTKQHYDIIYFTSELQHEERRLFEAKRAAREAQNNIFHLKGQLVIAQKRHNPVVCEACHLETKARGSQAAPSQAAPSQAAPSQAAPSQAAPSQAAPSQAAPSQAAPSQAAPSQAPGQALKARNPESLIKAVEVASVPVPASTVPSEGGVRTVLPDHPSALPSESGGCPPSEFESESKGKGKEIEPGERELGQSTDLHRAVHYLAQSVADAACVSNQRELVSDVFERCDYAHAAIEAGSLLRADVEVHAMVALLRPPVVPPGNWGRLCHEYEVGYQRLRGFR